MARLYLYTYGPFKSKCFMFINKMIFMFVILFDYNSEEIHVELWVNDLLKLGICLRLGALKANLQMH